MIKSIEGLLSELNIKPTNRAIKAIDNLIQNNGGYEKFAKTFKKRAPVAPIAPSSPIEPIASVVNHKAIVPSRPLPSMPIKNEESSKRSIPIPPPPPLIDNFIPIPPPLDTNQIIKAEKTSDRNNLLNQIKQHGGALRPIEKVKEPDAEILEDKDMISQLKDALNNMRGFLSKTKNYFLIWTVDQNYCNLSF